MLVCDEQEPMHCSRHTTSCPSQRNADGCNSHHASRLKYCLIRFIVIRPCRACAIAGALTGLADIKNVTALKHQRIIVVSAHVVRRIQPFPCRVFPKPSAVNLTVSMLIERPSTNRTNAENNSIRSQAETFLLQKVCA